MTSTTGAAGTTGTAREPDEILLGFTVALRAGGVPVTHDRAAGFLAAAALVGLDDAAAVHHAGRATLCGSPADLERYDQVYDAYFNARDGLPRRGIPGPSPLPRPVSSLPENDGGGTGETERDVVRAMASDAEVLANRDVATLTADERARLAAMFATLRPRPPLRRGGRRRPWHAGDVDADRTLRDSLRRMGEPAEIRWRRHAPRPRTVVLLIDVSGSMSSYADALLRLAHRITHGAAERTATGRHVGRRRGRVETFSLGTRLTHLTRALAARDPERALVAAGQAVPDWSGGTRLGETLKVFLDRHGRRGLARGAVVVVFSDGWERGDAQLLGEQMAQLHRIANRVIWVNPHRGKSGYEPVQRGIVTVLPHVDDFVAGHSLAAFAELTEVIARA